MSNIIFLVILFIVFGLIFAGIAFFAYRRALRHAKGVERGLKMVPLLIHLPPPADDEERSANRDMRQLLQEKVSQAEILYDLISGTAQNGFKSNFYGQRHIALEIVATGGLIHYFVAVPVVMVSLIEQAVLTAYPGAKLEEVEDHNIFNPKAKLVGTSGGELILKHPSAYPISTYKHIERDPMEALLNALSKLQQGDGAAVQIMIRPARKNWIKHGITIVAKKRKTKRGSLAFTPGELVRATYKTPQVEHQEDQMYKPSKLEESVLEQIEEKTRYPGYETLIRVVASSTTYDRSQILLRSIINSFSLFEAPGMNGFQFYPARDIEGLVTAFIFRFFPPELSSNVLNSPELATIFHFPDAQYTPTSQLERQTSKQVDGPVQTGSNGLLMGYNIYRGTKKEIRLSPEDRRRHTYVVGQTGTGKSTVLENMAIQDMLAGNGFAFIDPHGDTAEKLISMVPKERAEDVIYFNPSDMDHPLGLNLFEATDSSQQDFLINEAISMLYKIYDPGKTGIIGPRFEHWFRNAALTLMADPNGASLIEIPKVFTDSAYLKNKFKYLSDPTVIDFWTKEMGQTSDYHKSEMLGWFVSKFGAFMSNELMRNIIGQTKSSFNLREIMDNKKIFIVNLSKGRLGDINAQYLGMIFVIKFQAAAMSRAGIPESQRNDFCLYVDEFQNYSTDSFASILSEARKYRLNLIVANQFIGQLTDEIRDAVFGNVGTIMSYRCGPEDAEFLVKQFAPIFDVRDLVGLPNFNAVMRLMVGGLPSRPFSVTALPPLGVAHQEMGLAVKQLSAAKYGVPREQVEADIFARLQSKPAPVISSQPQPVPSPPLTAPSPAPTMPNQSPPAVVPVASPAPTPALPQAPAVAPPISNQSAAAQLVGATPGPVAAGAGNVPQQSPTPRPLAPPAPKVKSSIADIVSTPVPVKPDAPSIHPLKVRSADVATTTPPSNPPLSQSEPVKIPADPPRAPIKPADESEPHNAVQDEINELANEAMHHSVEEAEGYLSSEPPKIQSSPSYTPKTTPTTTNNQTQPLKPSPQPAPAIGPIQSPTSGSDTPNQLAIEAPHELLLPDHAGAADRLPDTKPSAAVTKPVIPKSPSQTAKAVTNPRNPDAPIQSSKTETPPGKPEPSSKPIAVAENPLAQTISKPAPIPTPVLQPKAISVPKIQPKPPEKDPQNDQKSNADLAEATLHNLEDKLKQLPVAPAKPAPNINKPSAPPALPKQEAPPVPVAVNVAKEEIPPPPNPLNDLKVGEIKVDEDGNVIMGQ